MKKLIPLFTCILLILLFSACTTRQKNVTQASAYRANGADSTKNKRGYKPKDERNAAAKIAESIIDHTIKEQQEKRDKRHPAQRGWPPRNNP